MAYKWEASKIIFKLATVLPAVAEYVPHTKSVW